MKTRVLPALLLSAFLGVAAPQAMAQQFSSVVVFGDSLSDAGYYRPVLTAAGVPASLMTILGRFTTAPGPVWSELIAQYYGVTPAPSNVAGGTIFAQGGARVTANSSEVPTGAAQRPISTQITEFLSRNGGVADPNALYAVWAGANDVIQSLGAVGAGLIPADQLSGIIQSTAVAEIGQIARLQAAGARYIIVFGLPNIGATPGFTAAGAATAAAAAQLSAGYNLALFTGLATAGIRVIPVDAFAFVSEVRANPAAFGFTNITTPACRAFPPFSSAPDALFCPPTAFLQADADRTFLFADGIHPTTAGHAIIAQFVQAMIDGPMQYSLLAEAPLASRRANIRTLVDSLTHALRGDVGRWNVFATATDGNFTIDPTSANTGVDGSNKGYNVGVAARVSESVTLGASIGQSEFDGSFGGGMGSYKHRESVLSLLGSMRLGGLWGYGVLSISDIDFRDLRRDIVLGPMVRTTNANTGGSNASAYFSAGYDFAAARLNIGPMVAVTSQNVEVNGFEESGADSSNLRISSQKRRSEVWSAGLRAYLTGHAWVPWIRVTADRERRDEARLVTASPISLASGNSYDVPAYAPRKNSTTAAVGIHGVVMERVGLSLSYYKVFGRSGVKEDGINGVLSYRF